MIFPVVQLVASLLLLMPYFGLFDYHKFDLRRTCIKLLSEDFDDFKKIYFREKADE